MSQGRDAVSAHRGDGRHGRTTAWVWLGLRLSAQDAELKRLRRRVEMLEEYGGELDLYDELLN